MGLDETKPFFKDTVSYLKVIQSSIFVLEQYGNDDFDSMNQLVLTQRLKSWFKTNESIYNDKADLINKATSGTTVATTKFNDTPDSQGDYSAEKYTSTVTTNTVEGKLGSEEQIKLLKNLSDEYLSQFFKRFVIYEY